MSVLNVSNENFNKEVILSKIPVLVDFWASWCGPCKIMGPIVEKVDNELGEKVKVCKINVDENQDLAVEYGIMSIPTFLVFKDGKVTSSLIGVQDKDELIKILEK